MPRIEAVKQLDENLELLEALEDLVMKQQSIISEVFQDQIEEKKKDEVNGRIASRRAYKAKIERGAKVRMWKQDPAVKSVPIRTVFLPNDVAEGPSDPIIKVRLEGDKKIQQPVKPDGEGDLILDEKTDPFQFDLVQAYTVVRMVVNMYQRDLQEEWKWAWDQGKPLSERQPIEILCHAGEKQNAAYLRSKRLIKLYYFHDSDQRADIYLCRSLDIVAHEAGHAVFDSLKPQLYSVKKGQQGALHEAFADLTAIFCVLSQFDLCEDIIAQTKGDLRSTAYLSGIGEQFAKALEDEDPADIRGDKDELGEEHNSVVRGVRDANNTMKGSEVKEVYDISQVFTGFMFDLLCDVFDHERNFMAADPADTLYRVARILRRIFLIGIQTSGPTPDFKEITDNMIHGINKVAYDDEFNTAFWIDQMKTRRIQRELESAGKGEEEYDIGGI